MKKLVRSVLILGLSFVFALLSANMTSSAHATTFPNLSGATLPFQATPTSAKDKSEPGSTDEITVMGGVIAAIIFAPIFLSRKYWNK